MTPQHTSFPHDPLIQYYPLEEPFVTQVGETIQGAFLAYKTWGSPELPAIVYPTWYSGSIADNEWLISEEHKGLDPTKYFIVVPALIGNGQSISPSNCSTGASSFPATTMFDNVKAHHELVTKHLGIKTLFAVLGWSMGAAQTFQWAVSYPSFVQRIVPFCGAARTAHHNVTFLRSLVLTLSLDPKFQDGNYAPDDQPQAGKRAFAAIYSSWGFSQAFYRAELFKELGFATRDDFLTGFWDGVFAHKDANNLLHLLSTWITSDITCTPDRPFSHDPANGRSSQTNYESALASITAKSLVMPCKTDLYFPPEDSEIEVASIPGAKLDVIPSVWGHFAGGPGLNEVDVKYLDEAIAVFFEETQ